ncbi:MAG: GntR family transcriptional regulator [Bacteroidota bacterium]
MSLQPHLSLKSRIAGSLRSRLLAGEWEPGTRLKEELLAFDFQVSRSPIRDILLELTKEGYLQAAPNKGVSVRNLRADPGRGFFVRMRCRIESFALADSVPGWSEASLNKLQEILIHFRVAAELGNLPGVIEQDIRFHRALVESYSGAGLIEIWLPLMTTMAFPYSRHANLMESYEEHLPVYNSIREGDRESATRFLVEHIR